MLKNKILNFKQLIKSKKNNKLHKIGKERYNPKGKPRLNKMNNTRLPKKKKKNQMMPFG